MPNPPIDFSDVQGLLRFGYGALTDSCFLLLNIRDAAAAREWLAGAPVTNAVELEKAPDTAVQFAFTVQGLRAIGLPDELITGFSNEFLSGLSGDESRSRRLGDVGPNAPAGWAWGHDEASTPHVVVLLYCLPGLLDSLRAQILGPLWDAAFSEIACLMTSNMHNFEPFGFKDGISQPTLDWKRTRDTSEDTLDYTNLVSLGEFLLGYPNEYGKYTDRPLLPAATHAALPPSEENAAELDFGHNGSYIVFRQLEQDVAAFWQFAQRAAEGDARERERISAAMVGRHRSGDPVVPLSLERIGGIDRKTAAQNNFNYGDDQNGLRCPLGSHIRRTNPRNADMPTGTTTWLQRLFRALGFPREELRQDVLSSTRFHRLLRRGREYGTLLTPEDALTPSPAAAEPRGIFFICLNANIARQFEFVQSAWAMNANFDGLTGEVDPLLGPRCSLYGGQPTDSFSMPESRGPRKHISGMPQFVTVRGGAYFFLPSLTALRYIAQQGK
jgi:Dyp-type peroxidase family